MFRANAVTGEVCGSAVDLELPGFLPLEFERKYRSLSSHVGVLGTNWLSPLDQSLRLVDGVFIYRDAAGHETPLPQTGAAAWPVVAASGTITLSRRGDALVLDAVPLRIHFQPAAPASTDRLFPESITNANGSRVQFLGHNGPPQRIVDTVGRELEIEYDRHGRVLELALRDVQRRRARTLARYTYTREGDLASAWTPRGRWEFQYVEHLVVGWRSPWNESGYAAYDDQRRCVHLWHEGGYKERRLEYDDRRHTARVINSLGYATVYQCTDAWVIKETIDALGETESSILDDRDQVLATINPLGLTTSLTTVDPSRGLLRVVDASGAATTFQDDEYGRLLKQIDACGHTWAWNYDEAGNLIGFRTPSGAESRLTYVDGFVAEIRDIAGRVIHQRRSVDGRRVAIEDAEGPVATFEYDELGNVVSASAGDGVPQRVELDEAGRVVAQFRPDGTFVRTEYAPHDQPTLITDEQGRTVTLDYDIHGQCTRVRWPGGRTVQYEYDREGNPITVTNERDERHQFVWDAVGRVAEQFFIDGRRETYSYDARGRLTGIDDGDGGKAVLVRNAVGKIAEKRYADGLAEAFDYDPLRRLITAENPTGRVGLDWDPDGNLIHESQVNGAIEYAYSPGGDCRSLKTSAGRQIDYVYDARGRVTELVDTATGTYQFAYDRSDRLVERVYPNGAVLRIAYDERSRVTRETLISHGETLLSQVYEFDSVDRLMSVERNGVATKASYDDRDRTVAYGGERYRYDATGNLTFSSEHGEFSYNHDQLVGGGGFRREYDSSGATLRQHGGHERIFHHDGASRLRRVQLGNGQEARYEYDALGRRTSKSVADTRVDFLWDGFCLLAESSETSTIDYLVFPTFLPLARSVDGRVEYFVADRRGCVVATLDESGGLQATFDYTAFGTLRGATAAQAPPFRLRGQYFDSETGLHYSLHRYYEPETAHFLTPDPIGMEGGRNLYRYPPNPLTWEDPFGLSGACQGDVFYRAMSTKEKNKVMADCQLHAKNSKCPEGPYVTQTRAYCESALAEKPKDYQHLVEICTKSGTAGRLTSSPFAGRNGSQATHFPSMKDVVSGQVNRIEHKWERLGRPDEALNYGLSKGEGLKQFNGEVESMKVVDSGENCVPK